MPATAPAPPKQRDGPIEALRNLRIARRSAIDQRADTQRQIKALIVTAPDALRRRLRGLTSTKLRLTAVHGVGPDTAGQLLVTAGENYDRIHSEAAFAMLCGVAPIPAFSGKTTRHRLNRDGDRQANAAIYRVVLCRLRRDLRTRAYMERRTQDGMSKKEISCVPHQPRTSGFASESTF